MSPNRLANARWRAIYLHTCGVAHAPQARVFCAGFALGWGAVGPSLYADVRSTDHYSSHRIACFRCACSTSVLHLGWGPSPGSSCQSLHLLVLEAGRQAQLPLPTGLCAAWCLPSFPPCKTQSGVLTRSGFSLECWRFPYCSSPCLFPRQKVRVNNTQDEKCLIEYIYICVCIYIHIHSIL